MPSINRSTYVSSMQRGALPGPRNVFATGPSTRAFVDFDPSRGGLQRRVGTRPWDVGMMRQGCQPTGRLIGPPGFESEEYDCPFPIVGQPTWSQPMGDAFTQVVIPAAFFVAVGVTALTLIGGAYSLLSKQPARNPDEDYEEALEHIEMAKRYAARGDKKHAQLHRSEAKLHAKLLPKKLRKDIEKRL
jgi:hypothetical protein